MRVASPRPCPTPRTPTFAVSVDSRERGPGFACLLTGETADVDGTPVTNSMVLTLTPGPHTLTVTDTFQDGTVLKPSIPITAP